MATQYWKIVFKEIQRTPVRHCQLSNNAKLIDFNTQKFYVFTFKMFDGTFYSFDRVFFVHERFFQ